MLDDEKISKLAPSESEREIEKHDEELMQILGKWFDKPLSELPKKQREMAEIYIPRWLELSSAERRACAVEASRKVQETVALRFQQARREQDALPSGLAAQDAMRRGFNKVVRERAGERDFESKIGEVNLLDDRCIELAQMPELEIAEWIELTGVYLGEIGPYLVTPDSIGFVRWEPEEIRTYPKEFQVDMLRRNKHEPLKFPCTPARLLDFIDSKLSEIYGHFEVPNAFRQAVNDSAQKIDNGLQTSNVAPETEGAAALRASDEASPIATVADEILPADTQEVALAKKTQADLNLASLFDPVKVTQLEKMFPTNGKWKGYAAHAKANGLRDAAKDGYALFNPYLAAKWWIAKGQNGWDWARCLRTLANNLPARSIDDSPLLTGNL